MALMLLLYFDEIQAFKDTRMNDAIMIIIMKNCNNLTWICVFSYLAFSVQICHEAFLLATN